MTVFTGDNPFNVPKHADLLQTPRREIANWSENYWFVGWSPVTEAGLWLHAGRVIEDPDLFYGQTIAYLPGDELVVDRSFGRGADERGPSAGPLTIRCEEPHHRWTIGYDGAGQRMTRRDLSTSLGGAGLHELMRFEVELTAVSPVIDFRGAGASEQSWFASYFIQLMEMHGTLTVAGTDYELRGPVLRDHSMGPRTILGLGGDIFVSAVFEDGRALAALTSWDEENATNLHRGFIVEPGGQVELIERFEVPFRFDDPIGEPAEFEARLFRGDGSVLTLSGETVHGCTYSMVDPSCTNINGLLSRDDTYVLADCPARYRTADGAVGYGLFERGQRLARIGVPQPPTLGFAPDRRPPAVEV